MNNSTKTQKIQILNIEFDNHSKHDFLKDLDHGIVFTPNMDHLSILQRDVSFYHAYQQADFKLCDSKILYFLSKLNLVPKITEQIAGSDLFPSFCQYHKTNDRVKIFLLGGRTPSSLNQVIDKYNHYADREMIVGGYSPPFGFEKDEVICARIIEMINNSGANVLAVGLGAPKQEKWIIKYRHLLHFVDIFFAIGATIDFESGEQKRAPKFLTQFGLEWAYRMLNEPKRLAKRYLVDDLPVFYLLFLQKIGLYQNPWHRKLNGKSEVLSV